MFIVDFDDPNRRADGNMGCFERPMKVGANRRFPVWGTVSECPIIPRANWQEYSLRHKVWEVLDQGSQNSCCPTATRGATEIVREIMGQARIRLSQGSLYNQIAGGRDQGANIMDALEAMMDVGMVPDSIIDQYDWQGRGYPPNWKAEAAKYRILEAWDCPTFDEMLSAVEKQFPVVFGVNWAGGGHAITCIGKKKSGNTWLAEILNSWGADWGDGGFGYLTESQCKASTSYGAFAIRGVTIPSGEELPPMPEYVKRAWRTKKRQPNDLKAFSIR
jgi:hypothetical protein